MMWSKFGYSLRSFVVQDKLCQKGNIVEIPHIPIVWMSPALAHITFFKLPVASPAQQHLVMLYANIFKIVKTINF